MKGKVRQYLKIGAVALIVIMVAIIGYKNYGENKLDKAKELYSKGKYFNASMELDNIIYLGKEKFTFDYIKYSGYICDIFYSTYLEDEKYEEALDSLISSVKHCMIEEEKPKSDGEKAAFEEFKNKYYWDLSLIFGISADEANNLANMELKERDDKVKKLAEKYTANKQLEQDKQDQVIADRSNPVEVRNLGWDNNSSYMVATGDVYNKSDITIKFVELKIAFKDANGNVIDTTSTYAVGSEGLDPGEATKWEAMVERDEKIDSYSVSLIDFD